MPIYCDQPEGESYLDYIKLERIPTATVLLRVDYSSIDFERNFISIKNKDPKIKKLAYQAPPSYESGAYSTIYHVLNDQEKDLFAIRLQNKLDLPLIDVMCAIKQTDDVLGYFKTLL